MRRHALTLLLLLGAFALSATADSTWAYFEGGSATSDGFRVSEYTRASATGQPDVVFGTRTAKGAPPAFTFVLISRENLGSTSGSCTVDFTSIHASATLSSEEAKVAIDYRATLDRGAAKITSETVTVDGKAAPPERVCVLLLAGKGPARLVAEAPDALETRAPRDVRDARDKETARHLIDELSKKVPEVRDFVDAARKR